MYLSFYTFNVITRFTKIITSDGQLHRTHLYLGKKYLSQKFTETIGTLRTLIGKY